MATTFTSVSGITSTRIRKIPALPVPEEPRPVRRPSASCDLSNGFLGWLYNRSDAEWPATRGEG